MRYWVACNIWYSSETILNPDLVKSRLPITFFYISNPIVLTCSVQNVKTVLNFKVIEQRKRIWWANDISRDLGTRWVSAGYPILHGTPGFNVLSSHQMRNNCKPNWRFQMRHCLVYFYYLASKHMARCCNRFSRKKTKLGSHFMYHFILAILYKLRSVQNTGTC